MTTVSHSFLINVAQRQNLSIAAGSSTKVDNKLFANHPVSFTQITLEYSSSISIFLFFYTNVHLCLLFILSVVSQSTSLIWFARPLDWNTVTGRRRYSCGHCDRYDFTSQVPNSVTSTLPYGDATDAVVNASLSLNTQQRWPTDVSTLPIYRALCFKTLIFRTLTDRFIILCFLSHSNPASTSGCHSLTPASGPCLPPASTLTRSHW